MHAMSSSRILVATGVQVLAQNQAPRRQKINPLEKEDNNTNILRRGRRSHKRQRNEDVDPERHAHLHSCGTKLLNQQLIIRKTLISGYIFRKQITDLLLSLAQTHALPSGKQQNIFVEIRNMFSGRIVNLAPKLARPCLAAAPNPDPQI